MECEGGMVMNELTDGAMITDLHSQCGRTLQLWHVEGEGGAWEGPARLRALCSLKEGNKHGHTYTQ